MLGDEFLSQEELDSLLNGLNEEPSVDNSLLDMMGEVGNISMGAGATTMSTLLRRKVNITSPETSLVKFKDIKEKFNGNQLVITIQYKKGLEGLNSFVLPENVALIIANLMMGGDGNVDETQSLDEISMSAVGEAMNQMMGSSSTAISEFIKTPVDISPPEVGIIDFSNKDTQFPPIESDAEADIISVKFNMDIEGLASTTFWQFIPAKFAKHIEELMKKVMAGEDPQQTEQQMQQPMQQPVQQMQQPMQQPVQQMQQPMQQPVQQIQQPMQQPVQQMQQPMQQISQNVIQQGSGVNVNPVNFGAISGNQTIPNENVDMSKLQLLLDVPLEVTVELGNTSMSLREVLQLHQGSMLQLDKLAGEPLDIYANGKLIARGEVVVIEESFGVRITEIVSLDERLRSLK